MAALKKKQAMGIIDMMMNLNLEAIRLRSPMLYMRDSKRYEKLRPRLEKHYAEKEKKESK